MKQSEICILCGRDEWSPEHPLIKADELDSGLMIHSVCVDILKKMKADDLALIAKRMWDHFDLPGYAKELLERKLAGGKPPAGDFKHSVSGLSMFCTECLANRMTTRGVPRRCTVCGSELLAEFKHDRLAPRNCKVDLGYQEEKE